jgi:hypothetical protein
MERKASVVENLRVLLHTCRSSDQEIEQKRLAIQERLLAHSEVLDQPDFQVVCQQDLFEMLQAYDGMFFDNRLASCFESRQARVRLRFSKRMTRTGGLTSYRRLVENGRRVRDFEIAVSTTLLFNTEFQQEPVCVTGVPVRSRLDALQRIFEHELIHMSEMILWDDSSCARSRFRTIARNLFGHRESNHQLITPVESARSRFRLNIGDAVSFHYRGQWLSGIVNRINRRATVLVPNRHGERFDDGYRYVRYYVPLGDLKKPAPESRPGTRAPRPRDTL